MASDDYGPYDLLNDLDFERCLAANPSALSFFMLDACNRFDAVLPEVVLAGLREAHSFHSRVSTVEALETARVACWNLLGSRSCDVHDAAVCRVRAAICTMFPRTEDPFSTMNVFLDFATSGGLSEAELLALMRVHLTS
jgi:hypothetical protein